MNLKKKSSKKFELFEKRSTMLISLAMSVFLCCIGMGNSNAALGSSAAPVWSGVDMSQLPNEGADKFRASPNALPEPALQILVNAGINTFRSRIWNNPCADGRCDPAKYQYGNTTSVLRMARKCKKAGLQFVLDFHYRLVFFFRVT